MYDVIGSDHRPLSFGIKVNVDVVNTVTVTVQNEPIVVADWNLSGRLVQPLIFNYINVTLISYYNP